MKKTPGYLKYGMTAALAAYASLSLAQGQPAKQPEKIVTTEEIVVERAYKPVLADAVKIRRSPDLDENKPFKPNLSYEILDKKLELNTDIRKLQAQELADIKETILKNNYIKAGAGNGNTGLGELYFATGKDEALQAGIFGKHLNQAGDQAGQKYSQQQFGAFGRSIQDKMTLGGDVRFDRKSTNFYGYNPEITTAPVNIQKQTYSTLTLNGEVLERYEETGSNLGYAVKTNAYLLRNAFKARENAFLVSGSVSKGFSRFHLGATAALDFTGTKDSSYRISNNILRANPFVKLQGKNYDLTVGLNVVQEFGQTSRTSLLPAVTASFEIVPGFATLFGGYTGDVQKTTLLNLSNENMFINENILIKNALEKSNIYGGVKGNAGSGFGYKASASFKTIEDMPLFVNNFTKAQKFDVVYDSKTEVIGLEGEISVKTGGMFNWTGKFIATDYNTSVQKQAWFKPGLEFLSNVHLVINKKLTIDGEVSLRGDSKALTRETVAPFNDKIVSVKSYTDLSAGAEYFFREKVGLFLRVNNIFGTNYQRYLYYPSIGTTIFGGLNYSF
ncbi:TonB-dependent receptor [Hufsiella ginkgonis]|uniref:TonB-dependent receptor n=1 Tax=Hufsiella ginkgonis TaxID=2695274 RepID=A0A7K1XZ93_9SPHI|nr:TonB-dependent receptor [Hufsiella ginkgonis]MXV16290.1 hypothetical protein [Hufsiella ginkgonis]